MVIGVDSHAVIGGRLSPRATGLVMEWAAQHQRGSRHGIWNPSIESIRFHDSYKQNAYLMFSQDVARSMKLFLICTFAALLTCAYVFAFDGTAEPLVKEGDCVVLVLKDKAVEEFNLACTVAD